MLGLCGYVGFSPVVGGALSSCSVQASYAGFFCCGALALGCKGFSSCGVWTQWLQFSALEPRLNTYGPPASLLLGIWNLPRPGIEPTSPSLANGFFTTEFPSGKP